MDNTEPNKEEPRIEGQFIQVGNVFIVHRTEEDIIAEFGTREDD